MPGYYELATTNDGRYMFNLKAANHEAILTSESYVERSSAENGIASVRQHASDDENFERRTAADGSPFFVLAATNGRIIGRSEMYSSEAAMEHGIESVKTNADSEVLRDRTAQSA